MTKIDSFDPPRKDNRPARTPRPTSVPGLLRASVRTVWGLLRTMRTALWLLFVLALETVVATVVPQEPNVPATVARWRAGEAGPPAVVTDVLDAIGAFDVYASPLFLALLLLLFTSLTACLVPRIRSWWRITRHSRPPLSRHVGRQEHVARLTTDLDPEQAQAVAAGTLSDRRHRVRTGTTPGRDDVRQVAAEKGHVSREGGSLVFHLSFYVLLVAIVWGQLVSFTAQVGVVEGEGFTDTPIGYWQYSPGRWFGADEHDGWTVTMDRFVVDWFRDPAFGGTPITFEAEVTVTDADGGATAGRVEGNHPLVVDGSKIHLLDWGYAPRVIVRQGREVVYDGFVNANVGDNGFFRGAVKAPAAEPDVGLDVFLVAFAPEGEDGQPTLTGAPWADAPLLAFRSFTGDLQLSAAQNVNTLDESMLTEGPRGGLRVGEIVELGDDVSVEFAELRRWAGFQVSRRPQVPALLLGSGLLLLGLLPALYAYRRRVWVAAEAGPDGRTLVTVAGRAFQRATAFEDEFDELVAALRDDLDADPATDQTAPDPDAPATDAADAAPGAHVPAAGSER